MLIITGECVVMRLVASVCTLRVVYVCNALTVESLDLERSFVVFGSSS